MRQVRRALFALVATAVLAGLPAPADAGHPLFNDQGTLVWYHSLAEAQAAARQSGKLIFIESGRLQCANCRRLVERILPVEPVRSRIGAIAVGLAHDCDVGDAAVIRILESGIPNPTLLPLVGFVTPELRWVTGWCGGTTAPQVLAHLQVAEARYRCVQDVLKPRVSAAPAAEPKAPAAPAPLASAQPKTTPVPAPAPMLGTPPRAPAARPSAPEAPPCAPPAVAPAPPPVAAAPPAPPSHPTPVAPPATAVGSAGTLLEQARGAAARGAWGEVIRCSERAHASAPSADWAEMDALHGRAVEFCRVKMLEAERAILERRYADAEKALQVVRTQCEGTVCPLGIDAERGQRAVDRLVEIQRGTPDRNDTPERLRQTAYREFRGTRWAVYFRARAGV